MFGRGTVIVLCATVIRHVLAINNGLARTPQMGWNNWNSLGCNVSETLLLETATKLVNLGIRDVGYNYVVMDDCWSAGRDEAGFIRADEERFPHGMKWMAEQIHSQSLLYGMYSSAGHMTCAKYEGSLDHEKEDAHSFATWDVDYLKYDNCYALGRHGTAEASFNRYNAMAQALNATGKSILYSLCSWGEDYVNSWGVSIANSYRISGDIYDSFSRPDVLCSCSWNDPANPHCVSPGAHCSVMSIVNRVAPYADRGQPGGWQDLDMLEVGLGGMTDEEYKAHFSLWAALKSPLLIGADIRGLSPQALTILNNPAIIAINQDPLGRPAIRVFQDTNVPKDRYGVGEIQVWAGPLYGGDHLLLLVNAANKDLNITAHLEDIFVSDGPGGSAPQCADSWDVYDLWGGRMEISIAQRIVDNTNSAENINGIYDSADWYNSTKMSYTEGLKKDDPRLLGSKVGEVKAFGSWTVSVPRHAAKVYRLRNKSPTQGKKRYLQKDEL